MNKLGSFIVGVSILTFALSGATLAQSGEATLSPVPEYKSGDGFEIELRARVYQDFAWVNDTDGGIDLNVGETRAARLGFDAKLGSNFTAQVEIDFSGGETNFTLANIGWNGP